MTRRKGAASPITLDMNFAQAPGSLLDSRLTFSSPARNYLNAGVLTAIAANTPTFESWDGKNRGLALEPARSNLFSYSNDPTQSESNNAGVTPSIGDVGPGLITQLYKLTSDTSYGPHTSVKNLNQSAGDVQTFSGYFKAVAAATNSTFYLYAGNQYSSNGPTYHFRIDGSEGFLSVVPGSDMTNTSYGWRKLSGGIYQVWITGTWSGTNAKDFWVAISPDVSVLQGVYNGAVTESVQVFGLQAALANGPTSYVATSGAPVALAATTATFNDTSWLTTTQGTFVIEHDVTAGPVLGSGANTLIDGSGVSPYGTTKVALAWDGTTSDLVVNSGATTPGGLPTFSGTNIRLLATSGAAAAGHIKSILFYNTRLSVATMQALTAPTVVSTATPGVLRSVSVDNRIPGGKLQAAGAALTFSSRFRVKLGNYDCSELRLDFPNIDFGGVTTIGNSLNITACALERVTTVAESAPVYVASSRSFTVADGANTTLVSDAILPSAFTGLSVFPANTEFWVRVKGTVSVAGNYLPVCRVSAGSGNIAGSAGFIYDPAATTISPVDGTGDISVIAGSGVSTITDAYCPILIGKFVSGDPLSIFLVGDSIVNGVSGEVEGTFVVGATKNLGIPILYMAQGGSSQTLIAPGVVRWTPYMKYCRMLLDEMGTNDPNSVMDYFPYWQIARKTYGYDKVGKIGLFPRTTSLDNWITEINQTITRQYPSDFDLACVDMLKYGATYGGLDFNFEPQFPRGTDKGKWLVNGTLNYSTFDGTHPTPAAIAGMITETQTQLATITVS